MRNISGPAAFVVSLILTITLALAGCAAFVLRGLALGVLGKNSPDVARWMLHEGKMDLDAFGRAVNEHSFYYGTLELDKDAAPEHRLGRWLVAYHSRQPTDSLRALGFVLLGAAGLSLVVTVLIWLQRPPASYDIATQSRRHGTQRQLWRGTPHFSTPPLPQPPQALTTFPEHNPYPGLTGVFGVW
ncbi:MAG TPA: hypothetical protein VD971_04440 [Phycisphaerales bacterium]|nr:hypothetical protein [Phycisphaerales bacterium]